MWTSVSSKTWSARFALAAVTTIANTSFDVRVRAEAQPVPVKVCDPANRVTVYVWPRGPGDIVRGSPGHAVIRTYRGGEDGKGIYASYWPKDKKRILAKGVHHSVDLEDDIKAEGGEHPIAITLYSLNVDRINAEYLKFKKSGENWSILGSAVFFKDEKTRNCAGISHDLLLQGGLKDVLVIGNSAVYRMLTDPKFIGGAALVCGLVILSVYYPDKLSDASQAICDLGKKIGSYKPVSSLIPTNKTWSVVVLKPVYSALEYIAPKPKVPNAFNVPFAIDYSLPEVRDLSKLAWDATKNICLQNPNATRVIVTDSAAKAAEIALATGGIAMLPLEAIFNGLVTTPYEILSLAVMAKDAEVAKGYVDQVESVKSVTPVLDSLTVKSGKVVDEPRPS